VMPQRKEFREYLIIRLEHFSSLFLLPLFFAFSGLRTHVGLLNDATSWMVCLAIIGVAILGKMALVTTFLTGPLLNLADRAKRRAVSANAAIT